MSLPDVIATVGLISNVLKGDGMNPVLAKAYYFQTVQLYGMTLLYIALEKDITYMQLSKFSARSNFKNVICKNCI